MELARRKIKEDIGIKTKKPNLYPKFGFFVLLNKLRVSRYTGITTHPARRPRLLIK